MHPPTYRGLSFQAEMLSILRACIWPVCFWRLEWLEAESAWLEHAPFAFWIVDALRPRSLIELGTHDGYSYFAFCQAVKHLELDTRCHAVEHRGDERADFCGEAAFCDLRSYHDGRHSTFSVLIRWTFDDAPPHLADQSIDLFHIGGCHDYEQFKRQFAAWRPRLSDRGVVLFHNNNEQAAELTAIRRCDVQAEAACAA
jgi:hypothetical protein